MKELFEKVEIQIVEFEGQDVIITSGGDGGQDDPFG